VRASASICNATSTPTTTATVAATPTAIFFHVRLTGLNDASSGAGSDGADGGGPTGEAPNTRSGI